ncbi:MAG: right-handed parallel beta-helix repeat-containing protein [Gammaproteobacteria bacterium]|nr:right-handed parallel beta-helix repeat-containing protein [Gammaproteobacteria bacterium]
MSQERFGGSLRSLMLGCCVLLSACGAPEEVASPLLSADPIDGLRQALLDVAPGGLVEIPEGRFELDRSLTLSVSGVTLRGAGQNRSVLAFDQQRSGAEGLLVTADDVTLQGFAIENARGDAIKVSGCRNIVMRDLRAEWTGGPSPDNGAYGLYPVQCEGVLIGDSVAIGASDAGIYVGQSTDIVVRRNRAAYNVAGIEIENSMRADVYANVVVHNTGGILVFDLPGLPMQGGREVRVFRNLVTSNNTPNFAPEGNIVATVPSGTGILVSANRDVEIFANVLDDHGTAAVMVMSYLITGRPFDDPDYDPYPERIHVHGNDFGRSGHEPDAEPLAMIRAGIGRDLPPLIWDGFTRDSDSPVLCAQDNSAAESINLDAPGGFAAPQFAADAFDCSLASLPGVSEAGAGVAVPWE